MLRVDSTKGEVKTDSLPEDWKKNYIGGTGMAAKILYDEVPKGADPLGPDNVFIFGVGPFQGGSKILGSGRFVVCARSPLTGIFGESLGGGYNAEEFKKAGFDLLVVKGKAKKPVYLWVHDGKAEIKDASALWGKADAFETEDAIKKELGDPKIQVAPIV